MARNKKQALVPISIPQFSEALAAAPATAPTALPVPGQTQTVQVTNPFEPTVIMGGTVYVTHPSTAPPSYGPQTYFVQWLDIGINGNDSCQILDFSFNLSFDGGSFSLLTINPVGVKGQQIDIFGLQGTITRTGRKVSRGYLTRGIFGTPMMNKEFSIITKNNALLMRYIGSTFSQTLATFRTEAEPLGADIGRGVSISTVASNIASRSGIKLGFYIGNLPYTDSLTQSTQTGQDALGTLASMGGGQLRWVGNDTYYMAYPDFWADRWTVPHEQLLTNEVPEYETIQDLGLGVTGTGVLGLMGSPLYGIATSTVPSQTNPTAGSSGETTQPVGGIIRTPLTVNDPPLIIDLPQGTQRVKVQILVAPGQQTSRQNFITSDSNEWFTLSSSPLGGSFWQVNSNGGAFVPQAYITHDLFPDLDVINNGEFAMRLAVVTRDLTSNYEAEKAFYQQKQQDLLNRVLANLRFIKTYEGSFSCFFFGSLPMPGMWASATACGETVEGIIQSVSFSHPGILTVEVAQFLRINFNDTEDNYSAQGAINSVR